MDIINRLADAPIACVLVSLFLYLSGYLNIFSILDSLLKMHRSRSAVKKLKKDYTFLEKLQLRIFEANCLHAVRFSKILIWFQRIRSICFALYLIITMPVVFGLYANVFFAYFTIGMFVCFDISLVAIHFILARPVFGKFNGYSFEKYHNTRDHDSLL